MPQLDFSNSLTLAQVVWMALIFGALYFLLSNWALPQVAGVLESRAARIAADLDTARQAKAEADAAMVELQTATRKAATEAQAAIAEAMAQAKAEAAEQSRLASQHLEAQLSEAEGRIAAARSSAMGALRDVAAETATAVVARLTGRPADRQVVEQAVTQVLAPQG